MNAPVIDPPIDRALTDACATRSLKRCEHPAALVRALSAQKNGEDNRTSNNPDLVCFDSGHGSTLDAHATYAPLVGIAPHTGDDYNRHAKAQVSSRAGGVKFSPP
jgi:hypothetical protein